MLKIIYKLYNKRFSNDRIDDFYKRVYVRISNILFYLLSKLQIRSKYHSLNSPRNLNERDKYIVTLTTIPTRIDYVWLAIESILRQTSKPEAIILWLYKGEFNGRADLPKNLLKLEERGLNIQFCKDNIEPHKKYFYTIRDYPDANIITIDDDVIYPPDLIENLKKYQKKFPDAICCTVARKIKIGKSGILPYEDWEVVHENAEPSFQYLQIGAGGVLYPPNSLDSEVLNIFALKDLALLNDDLWLKVMSLKNQTKVVSLASEYPRFFIPLIIKNNKQLMKQNIGEGLNDDAIMNIMKHYGLDDSIFRDFKP